MDMTELTIIALVVLAVAGGYAIGAGSRERVEEMPPMPPQALMPLPPPVPPLPRAMRPKPPGSIIGAMGEQRIGPRDRRKPEDYNRMGSDRRQGPVDRRDLTKLHEAEAFRQFLTPPLPRAMRPKPDPGKLRPERRKQAGRYRDSKGHFGPERRGTAANTSGAAKAAGTSGKRK